MGSWRFSVWRSMLSANSDNFISSFLTWMSGISIKTWRFGVLWKLGSYLNSVWAGFLWPCAPAGAAPQLPGGNTQDTLNTEAPHWCWRAVESPVLGLCWCQLRWCYYWHHRGWQSADSPAGPPLISLSSRRWGSTPSSHLILADAVGTGQKGRWGIKTCNPCYPAKTPLSFDPVDETGDSVSPAKAQQSSKGILPC